jgi:hypothetical protein
MENKEYIVTPQGSLGLLALGHIGIKKWREAINANKKNQDSKATNERTREDEKK